MTAVQAFALVAITAAVTMLTRALPFILFPPGKKTRPFLQYLGRFLPGAIVGMLVVYCLKGINFTSASGCVPELTAAVFVAAVHKWKHNLPLSIAGGTVLYMILIRIIP